MASRELKKTLNPAKRVRLEAECSRSEDANEEEEEEEEESQLEDFEREVKEMAQKIIDLRRSIPERLGDVASSTILSSLRPKLPPALGSIATHPAGADSSSHPVDETGGRDLEKLNVFREKAMSTIASAPAILKRVSECLARINKIKQCNVDIHSAFKRRKK
ncbi:hypothetical protein KSP39_PZI004878 [Platanthera zijinensis]|uniref:Uncharacterized protein n=1 Tax=Platanthera zijinensis TaxID=2320716 RepID=A0AAP0GCL5_9ASPA